MHSDLSSRLNSSTTKTSGNGYFDIETLLKNLFGNLCSLKTIGNISSRFSRNSEAFTSEFLENLEKMFPWYYMHSDIFSNPRAIQKCGT